MNLYIFTKPDSSSIYGIGTYVRELERVLKGADIHTYFVHLRSDRKKFEIEKTDTVEHWYIPEVHYENNSMDDYVRNVVYLLRLHIRDVNNLVFHFNYNNCKTLLISLKSAFECKTVTVIHYTKWQIELDGNLDRLHAISAKPNNERTAYEQMVYNMFVNESIHFAETDKLIALSWYMKNLLQTDYHIDPYRVVLVPNGLTYRGKNEKIYSCNNPQNENTKDTLRRKWRIPENEFLILFVGRLSVVKGLIYLIGAFRKVLDFMPNCRLIIAGSGDYNRYFQEIKDISTKITFTGLLEKKELYELYSLADLGVMPSFNEQCSYVAIEMMMHGVPLIASTTTGLKEMVEDGATGLHIPVVEHPDRVEIDISLLADKMLYLLQHPDERKRMGANACRRYEKIYSSELFGQNILSFYQSLFEKRKNIYINR